MHIKAKDMNQFDVFIKKISELRALLFLSSAQTNQNLKFISKNAHV